MHPIRSRSGADVTAFTRQEYHERIAKTQARMRQAGIEVLWVTSPPNINYLCGYDAWSFYVHQGLLLALDEPDPIWIGRGIDVPCVRHTSFLDLDNVHGYGDEYLVPPAHAMEFVAGLVRSLGWSRSVIGVEMDTHYFTARACERLRASLPRAHVVDADRLVNWVRIVKSEREIEYLSQAAQITDIAMRTGIESIVPGARQCDVAGAIYRALICGHPEFHGDVPDFQTMPKGARTAAPHLSWTAERYEPGEPCTLELGANRFRYHAPLSRTVHLGRPPERLVRLSRIVREGLESALAAVKPGITCEAIEAAWRGTVAPYGLVKQSRIGYSVGIGYPPDWGERTASLMPGDRTELEPDMTFHLMLGIWEPDGGYEISETFRVTPSGHVCLSSIPRELIIRNG